jgi:putative pyruvate formate lyase activating enzyme
MIVSRPPAYLELDRGVVRARAQRAIAELAECRACPRDCGVDRLDDRWSACKTGRYAVVSSFFPHLGEEDCLRGWNGSGTIFFTHCNLRCVFCQNYDISQAVTARETPDGSTPEEIAAMMLDLQEQGCHNINFVTPEHVVPQLLEALAIAIDGGLNLPIIYNTSAYDAPASLALLDGIVDIYMPDFKYWSPERSRTYLKADDYPEVARAAIRAMHRQVGRLRLTADGLAARGVLLRHLVMPGALDETRAILEWVARELGTDTYINLMDQYRPAGKVGADRYPELNRQVRSDEFAEALKIADALGLRRLDRRSAVPPVRWRPAPFRDRQAHPHPMN